MTRPGKRFLFQVFASAVLLFFFESRSSAEIFYPWKDVYMGALDAAAWPGIVIAPGREGAFAFRLRIEKEGKVAEAEDFFYLVSEVGPNSPDGQYARMKYDLALPFHQGIETPVRIKDSSDSALLTLEWSRQDEKTIIGRLRCPEGIKVSFVFYIPWDGKGSYELQPDGHVLGQSADSPKQRLVCWTDRRGQADRPQGSTLDLEFSAGKTNRVYFVAAVGDDPQLTKNHIYRYKNRKAIDSLLEEEESGYRKKSVTIDGLFSGAPEAVVRNTFWNVLYQPGRHRLYEPAARDRIRPRTGNLPETSAIDPPDSFFGALGLAVESPRHAVETILAALETPSPDGTVPGRRGPAAGTTALSQPPIGAYVVLKLFQKTGDIDFLKRAYPFLEKRHSFWTAPTGEGRTRRDGNGNGLLEWGSEAEIPDAEEIGPANLPGPDDQARGGEAGTIQTDSLDLNCLYALDAWCLAQVEDILNLGAEAANHLREYEETKTLINTELWNEKEGFYFDRHWDGRFSARKAASGFFPLIARIPDEKRALRMLRLLVDSGRFWGEFVIPSVSRDDPAQGEQPKRRGAVWPSTNYLVYQGLKAYGFDAVASDFAKKSCDLFLRSWQNFQVCPEYFDSRTGEAGGGRYRSSGPLFALIGIEEYLDFTPWEGFRFGMIHPGGKGTLSRLAVQGRHYEVQVSKSKTALKEEGKEIVRADGNAVFRRFLYNASEISFEVKTLDDRRIDIRFQKKGRYQLLLDERERKVFSGKSVRFDVPAGTHSVLILLIEEPG
ncbi:MAG: MGH1-like glycoside hydrolase domain-containing protein [Candidatus Aminicenantales bacterium]